MKLWLTILTATYHHAPAPASGIQTFLDSLWHSIDTSNYNTSPPPTDPLRPLPPTTTFPRYLAIEKNNHLNYEEYLKAFTMYLFIYVFIY